MLSQLKLYLAGAVRSRTMWAAAGVIVAGILQVVVGPLATRVLAGAAVGWMLIALGLAVAALRIATTQGLTAKVPPAPTAAPK